MKLNSKQLRVSMPTDEQIKSFGRNEIYLILDNVLDTYNIGSLFRLADAVAAKKLFICGASEYPPNSRIHKAAVGTENWTVWEKRETALEVVKELKQEGVTVVAVEQDERSISYKDLVSPLPAAIVIGHETDGVSKEVVDECDIVVELPMYGINKSLNVWGTAAVVAYKILDNLGR